MIAAIHRNHWNLEVLTRPSKPITSSDGLNFLVTTAVTR